MSDYLGPLFIRRINCIISNMIIMQLQYQKFSNKYFSTKLEFLRYKIFRRRLRKKQLKTLRNNSIMIEEITSLW